MQTPDGVAAVTPPPPSAAPPVHPPPPGPQAPVVAPPPAAGRRNSAPPTPPLPATPPTPPPNRLHQGPGVGAAGCPPPPLRGAQRWSANGAAAPPKGRRAPPAAAAPPPPARQAGWGASRISRWGGSGAAGSNGAGGGAPGMRNTTGSVSPPPPVPPAGFFADHGGGGGGGGVPSPFGGVSSVAAGGGGVGDDEDADFQVGDFLMDSGHSSGSGAPSNDTSEVRFVVNEDAELEGGAGVTMAATVLRARSRSVLSSGASARGGGGRAVCAEASVVMSTAQVSSVLRGPARSMTPPPPPPRPSIPATITSLPYVKGFDYASYNANSVNEDRSVIDVRGSDYHLFAVFDGHGGPHCAVFVESRISSRVQEVRDRCEREYFARNPEAEATEAQLDWKVILEESLVGLDRDFASSMAQTYPSCGSCCILCVVVGLTVYTACIGDSRALVCRRQRTDQQVEIVGVPLSYDQDCKNQSECTEVRRRTCDPEPIRRGNSGGPSPLRVAGSLMVTRALGDCYLKDKDLSWPPFRQYVPYITSSPIVSEHRICDRDGLRDEYLIMASDGLYNVLGNNEIAQLVSMRAAGARSNRSLSSPSSLLVSTVLDRVAQSQSLTVNVLRNTPPGPSRRKLHDDVTVICVRLGGNGVYDPHAEGPILSETSRLAREAQLQRQQNHVQPEREVEGMHREASTILLSDGSQRPKADGGRDSVASQPDDDTASVSSHNSGRGVHMSSTSSTSSGSSFAAMFRKSKKKARPSPPPAAPKKQEPPVSPQAVAETEKPQTTPPKVVAPRASPAKRNTGSEAEKKRPAESQATSTAKKPRRINLKMPVPKK